MLKRRRVSRWLILLGIGRDVDDFGLFSWPSTGRHSLSDRWVLRHIIRIMKLS